MFDKCVEFVTSTLINCYTENLVVPPGRRPYGPEAGPAEDPALRGSEIDGYAVKRADKNTEFRRQNSE